MRTVLVLGATGRTGAAVMRNRPDRAVMYAGMRRASYERGRRTPPEGADGVRLIDMDDDAGMVAALTGVDTVVNAIRLREDIPRMALVDCHERLIAARDATKDVQFIHVGGAGALRLGDGHRFWESPDFPAPTLPRGAAHAALRDHLEGRGDRYRWAYLIPPPSYEPQGPRTGRYTKVEPSDDEREFLRRRISYEDFSCALADAIREEWRGTFLIGG